MSAPKWGENPDDRFGRRATRDHDGCGRAVSLLTLALLPGLPPQAEAANLADQAVTVAGGHPGQLHGPIGVAVDSHGDVFVADSDSNRVQEWTPGATGGFTVAGGHGQGSAANPLFYPIGLALDSHGDVFVADTNNARVQEWTPGATRGITVAGGSGHGSLPFPVGVAVDGQNNIFVTDYQSNALQEWLPGASQGITKAGDNGKGAAANQRNFPSGVAIDGHGRVFVADTNNNRVQEIIMPPAQNPVDGTRTALTYYTTTSDDEAPPVRPADQVVLLAVVKPKAGTSPAHGTIDFMDGTTDLGAIPLYTNQATAYALLFVTLSPGPHTVIARYSGDNTFTSSESARLSITVTT